MFWFKQQKNAISQDTESHLGQEFMTLGGTLCQKKLRVEANFKALVATAVL